MFVFIGMVLVIASVMGGYLMEQGNLSVLMQPAEFIIIFGAALGGFVISSPLKVIKAVQGGVLRMFKNKVYSRSDYMDVLVLLSEIFYKVRKEGLVSIESDLDQSEKSPIFKKHPKFLKNHHALSFLTDTLRTLTITDIEAHELGALSTTKSMRTMKKPLYRPRASQVLRTHFPDWVSWLPYWVS